jgi:hypothetical protein
LQPGVNVTVQPPPATATAAAYSPSIKIRTHLWVLWARIAIKHEVMAQDARQQAEQPGVDQGPLFEAEMDASLTGICAAAFALEALSRELEELGLLPAATAAAWKNRPPGDAAKALEVLKVTLDSKGMVNTWHRNCPGCSRSAASPSTTRARSRPPSRTPWERTRARPRSPTRSRTPPGRSTCCWGSWSGAGTSPSPGLAHGPRPPGGSSPS